MVIFYCSTKLIQNLFLFFGSDTGHFRSSGFSQQHRPLRLLPEALQPHRPSKHPTMDAEVLEQQTVLRGRGAKFRQGGGAYMARCVTRMRQDRIDCNVVGSQSTFFCHAFASRHMSNTSVGLHD